MTNDSEVAVIQLLPVEGEPLTFRIPHTAVTGSRLRVELEPGVRATSGWTRTAPGVFERIMTGHEAPTVVFTAAVPT